MLVQCWASVTDGGPTLNQHYVNVSCLLGKTSVISAVRITTRFVCFAENKREMRFKNQLQTRLMLIGRHFFNPVPVINDRYTS